jgi:L-fucose isomerase
VELDEQQSQDLKDQTNPTWPHVWARLECSFDEFLNVFPCNHVQGVPGDRVEALKTACELANIQPVVLGRDTLPPIWEQVK